MLKKIFGPSQLDEMQEQQLARIESRGCWLAFWLLLGALSVETALGATPREVAAEWLVFMGLALYLVVACLRAGLWDAHLKPNFKTNFCGAFLAGAAVAALSGAVNSKWGMPLPILLAASLIEGACTLLLTLALLTVCAAVYRRRHTALETEPDEPDDTAAPGKKTGEQK